MAGQAEYVDRPTFGYGLILVVGGIGVAAITGNPITAAISVPAVMALAIGATTLMTNIHVAQVRRRIEVLNISPSHQNKIQVAGRLAQLPTSEILGQIRTARREFPIESVNNILNQSELDLHDRVMQVLDIVFPEAPPIPS